MRRFISLLCAILLVFSASAAPVAQKAQLVKKAPVAVEQVQKVQFEKAQTLNFNQLSAAPALKVTNQKANPWQKVTTQVKQQPQQNFARHQNVEPKKMVAKHMDKAQRAQLHQQAATVARAPKKAAQAEALTITTTEVDDSYVASDGEWDIYLRTNIAEQDVIVSLYVLNDELAGNYDLATNMAPYSCVYDVASLGYYFYEEFTACSFTVTSLGNDQYSCEGSFSIQSGDFTFSTTLSYTAHVPETYEVTASEYSDSYYYGRMVNFTTERGCFSFFINADELESGKTYLWGDMDQDPSYSCYSEDCYYVTAGYTDADLTKTVKEDGSFTVEAHATLTNGDQVTINYEEAAPAPIEKTREETIDGVNGVIKDYTNMGFFVIQADNAEGTRFVQLYIVNDEILGEYTEENMDSYSTFVENLEDKKGVEWYDLISANVNIELNQDGDTVITATYLGQGEINKEDIPEFTINITLPQAGPGPVVYDTIQVTVDSYKEDFYGTDWQVLITDNTLQKTFSFDILTTGEIESGKTYTTENNDFDLDWTFAAASSRDYAVKASFTKTETEDALSVTAEMTTAGNHVYQFTYELDKTVEVKDANGIIIQPAKGEEKEYNRLATNTCFYLNSGQISLAYQSGTATLVECADGTVYWKNPVSKYTNGAWIKGKKEGSTITFATKQPVSYSSDYDATLSVRWGHFSGSFAAADSYADSFILDIKGDSLIMRGTQATTGSTAAYFPGIFWDDDNSFQGYGDCGVNLYTPGWTPSTELITPPAGLVTAKMPFTGSGASEDYADSVLVGWDKDTVYIQGLAVDFPTAWIKGVLKEGVVTFEKFQFVGNYSTLPIWVLGTNANSELIDFTMTYDAQANLFKATNIFVVNASYEKIYYLDMVSKIVIGEVPQADWGEWEDFAPFGYNTGTWTFVVMANSPQSYSNYVALVRTDKNNADNKQIKITNWGEGWFGEGVELIINWNAKDNTCSIDKQFTGYVHATYGNVSIASVEDGTYNPETATFSIQVEYTVSAGSFGKDVETYVMDTKQPGMMYDTDAPFDAKFAWGDMSTFIEDGVISISATNADMQTIGLELYTDPANTTIPEGTYVISDSYEAGTALKSAGVVGGYLTECWAGNRAATGGIDDCWFMVEGTIELSYDEYGKLKVVIDAKNSYGQPVTALVQYEKLEPKSTVEINAEFSVYEGYVEQYGIMNFYGGNEEGYEFDLYAYATTHIGDFVDAVDFGDCEIDTPDGTVGVIDAYEFVVATEDGKHLTLTAKVLGSDTIQYNITATGFYGALAYDTNKDYEGDFNIVDLTIGQTGQYITIKGINEVGDSINFAFVGELVDNAIPAGEYTEVMVSTGLNAKNNPTTSFVWNAENYLWFVQSGTLTVNELGAMHFAGLNSYDKNVVINFIAPVPPVVTDYYLVGWINNAAYGIEGDIDNFGDYHFVDGKVTATFDELSYVQVKDNNKQIYGTVAYVAPVERGTATLLATGTEKVAINGGIEMEYTLVVNDDGTLTLGYAPAQATGLIDINAAIKTNKVVRNGRLMIIKDAKVYSVLGQQIQ